MIHSKTRLRKWIAKNFDIVSTLASSILSIALSIIAAAIYNALTEKSDIINKPSSINAYIAVTMIVFMIGSIILIAYLTRLVKRSIVKEEKYKDYIQCAYLSIQELSLTTQELLQNRDSNQTFAQYDLLSWANKCIGLSVDKCYNFFVKSFIKEAQLIEPLKFEVTFMTLSYKDGKITIPFFCNKERKKTNSMLMRDSNPSVYDHTISAQMYNEYNKKHITPELRIIQDTSKHGENETDAYVFIYDDQRSLSKSSIVLPVLSRKSQLLGTLVVYCNQANFFLEEDRMFWYEIMLLFASEIGTFKTMVDYLVNPQMQPF